MRGRLIIAIAVGLIGLVFAAGCGDDDETTANDSGSNTPAQTTDGETTDGGSGEDEATDEEEVEGGSDKAEFVAQANALCEERVKEIQDKGQKAFEKLFNLPEKEGAEKLGQQVLAPILSKELRELKALEQPAGDEEELNAFYAELEKVIDYFSANPQPGAYPYNKAENLAARYGIDRCGTPQ
jgi:hypothetical protein